MKATRKLVLIAVPLVLSAIAVSAPSFAQSADVEREDATIASARADPAEADAKRHDPVAFAQQRLTRLKSELAITPEQEPQWSAFTSTVLQQMEQFKAWHQGRNKTAAQTAPERIDRQVAWMKERTTAFETVGEAAKTLYAALSPEQQQIADEKLLRWHARRGS
jgi:protein CpxP